MAFCYFIDFSLQNGIVTKYTTNLNRESYRNFCIVKVASKHRSFCHKIQTRLGFIFSSVMFLLAPMPCFFHSVLTSCSRHWGAGMV